MEFFFSLSLSLSLSRERRKNVSTSTTFFFSLSLSLFLPSPPLSRRYVFLLYRQLKGPLGTSAREPKSRAKFQLKDWARTHGLECVDATFFSASADEE